MSKKNSRGSIFLSYFKFIKYKWGVSGLETAVKDLGFGPEDFKESGWYDMDLNDRTVGWISENKGEKYLEELGEYIVRDLGLLSYIVRFMNIESFLKKFRKNYYELFDYGSIEFSVEGPDITIRIKDNSVSTYSCPVWLGSCRGMLKATNTQGEAKKTHCQIKGHTHCQYVITIGKGR